MRRYDEDNVIKVLINWFLNVFKSKHNLNISVNDYNKKHYQN